LALPYRWQWRIERWRQGLRRFFGGGEKPAARPRLCPACGTLVGTTAKRCHECGTSLTFSLTAAGRSIGKLFGGEAPVTRVLLAINIAMFGITWLLTVRAGGSGIGVLGGMNGDMLNRLGANVPGDVLYGEQWRLVTAMFLHGGLFHIAMNMMVLLNIGPNVEQVYGSPRFLFLYVLTGVLSFVVSSFVGHISVGASGALMGLIGLMIAITTRRGGATMNMLRGRLLLWVGLMFVLGFVFPGVDNAAHLGGLVAGFLLGRIFADREPVRGGEMKRAYALGWLAGLALAASFALMVLHYFQFASAIG
jgi:rhomboid protease GluP